MKKKKLLYITLVVLIIAAGIYLFLFNGNSKKTDYTFGEITKGSIQVKITSTGTLEAISSVDVGTQVSGQISKLYADFNTEVKKGQLLAVIDTVTLAAQVADAKSSLSKAKADFNLKNSIYNRNKKLFDQQMLSQADFDQSANDLESSKASLSSADAALQRAKTNLAYAFIYSPISGKVINRAVEQGQTVAASYSTPTLFTIVEDLSTMRIIANVDESDIGQIKEGQKVKFTVQAYSDKSFDGFVTQIRIKSTTSSNVVNYPVVVKADNRDKLLLPGMTATIDFYVESRDSVLRIPNTALRFEPSDDVLKELKKSMEDEMKNVQANNKEGQAPQGRPSMGGTPPAGGMMPPPMGNMPDPKSGSKVKANMNKVYYLDKDNKMKMAMVMTGITDGKYTEVIASPDLKEGMKLIIGTQEVSSSSTKKSSSSSLTGGGGPGGGPGGPPMM